MWPTPSSFSSFSQEKHTYEFWSTYKRTYRFGGRYNHRYKCTGEFGSRHKRTYKFGSTYKPPYWLRSTYKRSNVRFLRRGPISCTLHTLQYILYTLLFTCNSIQCTFHTVLRPPHPLIFFFTDSAACLQPANVQVERLPFYYCQ